MFRAIVLLGIGALAGAGFVFLGLQPGADMPTGQASNAAPLVEPFASVARDRAAPLPTSVTPLDTATAARGGYASERLAAYESAATLDDAGEVEARIEGVALEPESPRRDLELEALLARLAELDPQRALRLARSLLVDDRLVVAAFAAAAATSAGDALDELSIVRHPALQRDIALALLDTLGDDDHAIERIAAALPEGLRPSFEMRVLVRRARHDAASAVRGAARLDNPILRQIALNEIALELDAASASEVEALAASIEVEDPTLASGFRSTALTTWARSDPAAALDYLESAGPFNAGASFGLVSAAATTEPERVLGMLDRLPSEMRSSAQTVAIRTLAERDPLQAMRLLDTMPAGSDRDNVVRAIAVSYARRDPDAAIAWVRSLQPPPQDGMSAIVSGVAAVDFDRAIDLVLQELSSQSAGTARLVPGGLPAALSSTLMLTPLIVSGRGAANAAGMTRLAEGLLALDSTVGRSALTSMLGRWAQVDAARATDWLLANFTRVPPESLNGVAQQIALADVENAKRLTDTVPAEAREGWVASVAGVLAQTDVTSAVAWIERLRGQPSYDAAMLQIVQHSAQYDPAAAARLVTSLSPASQARASTQLVLQWAQQDPAAAARWAETIADDAARGSAVNQAARQWAQGDAAAAARWARTLQNATIRDTALGGVFAGAAAAGAVDIRLLDEISAGPLREQAALNGVSALARSDPEAARRLLPYIANPPMREQAERMLTQAGSLPAGFLFTN